MTVEKFIDLAIKEDIGDGDHTSLSCIPQGTRGKARILIKQEGVLAGVDLTKTIYNRLDADLKLNVLMQDGAQVKYGDVVLTVEGSTHSILLGERLVLNFMQRMSGIATKTNQMVKLLAGLKTKILDTRKTTPNLRYFEKLAVKIGGGVNHRMGLYDMIMIKDNHVDFAGGIGNAIRNTSQYLKETGRNLKIEIETRSLKEVEQVIDVGGVDRIMLDNFSLEDTRKAVMMIDGRYETEASGGINEETIRAVAECGVDFVSVGALTHQIKSLDISMEAMN